MKRRTIQKGHSLGRQSSFNWQLLDDPQPDENEIDLPRSRHISQRAWFVLASAAFIILIAGYWAGQQLVYRAESNLHQVQGEVAQAIEGGINAGNEITASTNMSRTTADVTLLQLYGSL